MNRNILIIILTILVIILALGIGVVVGGKYFVGNFEDDDWNSDTWDVIDENDEWDDNEKQFNSNSNKTDEDFTVTQNGNVTNIESVGNLESKYATGCVGLEGLTNNQTPADIIPGMVTCIENGEYEKGIEMYVLAVSYGSFDADRVYDTTAHQVITVLMVNNFSYVNEDYLMKFDEIKRDILLNNPVKKTELCNKVKKIGPPNYYPKYMIAHGMESFTGSDDADGINDDFDADESWNEILENACSD